MKKTAKVCFGLGGSLVLALVLATREAQVPNTKAAIGSLRAIANAQVVYREGDADENGTLDYAPSLEALGAQGLIPPELADGEDQGYTFWLERPKGERAQFVWYGGADPVADGERHLGMNMVGLLFFGPERCEFTPNGSSTASVLSGGGVEEAPPEAH